MLRLASGVMATALLLPLSISAQGPAKLAPNAASVVNGNNAFALDLYARLAAKDGNLFFSPYSISNALAMTYGGARGATAQQMAAAMHFDLEPARFHAIFGQLVQNLAADKRKFQLRIANRLWGQKDYGFLPEFLQLTQKKYQAGLGEVDFIDDTEGARKTINAWIEEQTKQKIKDLFKPGVLNPDTRLVLTNAIYFKAAWLTPFDPKATKDEDFLLAPGKKVSVPMMRSGHSLRFSDDGMVQTLELPYEHGEASMIVLLPKRVDGLPALEKSLTADNLKKWLGKLSTHQVQLTLPKFKFTAEFSLNEALKQLGMVDAFDHRKADFSGMSSRERLFIQHVVHKAYVDVNEAGTEAAAATGIAIGVTSLPQPATFRADHPFVFLIRDNRTGAILFAGRVVDPGS